MPRGAHQPHVELGGKKALDHDRLGMPIVSATPNENQKNANLPVSKLRAAPALPASRVESDDVKSETTRSDVQLAAFKHRMLTVRDLSSAHLRVADCARLLTHSEGRGRGGGRVTQLTVLLFGPQRDLLDSAATIRLPLRAAVRNRPCAILTASNSPTAGTLALRTACLRFPNTSCSTNSRPAVDISMRSEHGWTGRGKSSG